LLSLKAMGFDEPQLFPLYWMLGQRIKSWLDLVLKGAIIS
jgi:hypothetical protein